MSVSTSINGVYNPNNYTSKSVLTQAEANSMYLKLGGGVVNGNVVFQANEIVDGNTTFSNLPSISSNITPTSSLQLIHKAYVDTQIAGVQTSSLPLNPTFQSIDISGNIYLPANSILDSYLSSNVDLLNSNQTISGTKTFTSNPIFPSHSISDSSLSTNVDLLNSNQTISGVKTFTSNPVFPSHSISDSSLSTNIPLLNANNVFSNPQNFTNGILVSGSSTLSGAIQIGLSSDNMLVIGSQNTDISGNLMVAGTLTFPSHSISDSYLSTNVDLLNSNQTISGTKTFSSAPILPANSILDSYLSSNVDLLNSNQTISGTKTFTSAPILPVHGINDSYLSTNIPFLNGTNTFTGTNTFGSVSCSGISDSGSITTIGVVEKFYNNTTASGNTYVCDMSLGNVQYLSNPPTSNFTLDLINCGTSGNSITLTLIYTSKYYPVNIAVFSGALTVGQIVLYSTTPLYPNGVSSISMTYGTIIISQISIMQMFPNKYAICNVIPCY